MKNPKKLRFHLKLVLISVCLLTLFNAFRLTSSPQEETTGIYLPPTPSPPPAYEAVVKIHKKEDAETLKKSVGCYNPVKNVIPEDDDLPSYETAIKLRDQGYI